MNTSVYIIFLINTCCTLIRILKRDSVPLTKYEIVRNLCSAKISDVSDTMSEILKASQTGDFDYFRRNLNEITQRSAIFEYCHPKSGDTVVHFAARHGHVELLKLFLSEKFNLEISNFDGKKALHEAAQAGQLECLVFLLTSGVQVDALKRADW